jgi:hypothetical protein
MTYNKDTAEIEVRSKEEWLNLMLQDGSEYWGEDITERNGTAIHYFYRPFANQLHELEQQLQQVQYSLRIDDAEGQELDYLGERLGVVRRSEQRAKGVVTFSRNTTATKDYLIQEGTRIKTSGTDGISFETTEEVILTDGTSSVNASIQAVDASSRGNVASNTITNSSSNITGVDSVTNTNPTSGGRDNEKDSDYRDRIKRKVGAIDVASGQEIYNQLSLLDYVKDVRYIDNSTNDINNNLDPHEVELVVDAESGHNDEIAQVIWDNLAMGANLISGAHGTATTGTATLDNGQSFTVDYTNPNAVDIYVDADVTVTSNVSKNQIKTAIVEYIGGVKPNGEQIYGDLTVEDNVLYGEVSFAIRDIEGVYDVTNLYIDTSSPPSGTSNITISSTDRASIDETNITLNTSQK